MPIKRWIVLTLFLLSAWAHAAAKDLPGVPWMDGKPYFPLGVNYAWKDWGKDFATQGWPTRFKAIQADLDLMRARGVRSLRWWVYTDFVAAPLWQKQGQSWVCVGMPKGWVKNFVAVCDAAHARGIKLYPTFSSFDMGLSGMDGVLRDPRTRKSFIDAAVVPLLKATSKHPGIFAWDVINEPEWLIRKEDGGDPNKDLKHGPFTLAELRSYVRDVARAVHLHAKQPVSVGSASMKWCGVQYDFWSGLDLDFFDIHYYDWQTPYFNITTMGPDKLRRGVDQAKPVIIGETISIPETQYSGPGKPKNHQRFAEDVLKLGYAGYLAWAWNEKPDLNCSTSIEPSFNQFLTAHPQIEGRRP